MEGRKLPENALSACMGAAFAQLPDVIRRAHQGRIRLSGTAEVTRGRGIAGWLAGFMNMPESHPAYPMEVDGDHQADAMHWSRSFNGRRMVSMFRRDGGHLVENMGPIKLRLRPVAEAGRLVYRLEGAKLGPLPLPGLLMPRLVAWEGERDGFYDFEVDVGLPLIGRLIRYRGKLRLSA